MRTLVAVLVAALLLGTAFPVFAHGGAQSRTLDQRQAIEHEHIG